MTAMSNHLASRLLNLVLRNQTYSPANPNYLYVALFYSSSGLDGGSLADEVDQGNYARAQINLQSSPMFTSSTNGSIVQNATDITFVTCATADWAPNGSEVTSAAIMDGGTLGSGNILIWGSFTTAKEILIDDQFKILAGDFKIQFT